MINHNIINGVISLLTVTAGAVSCTGKYLEINTNPYEVGKSDMDTDGYNIGAALTALAGTVISTDVNTAQFTDCVLGGPMGGYYSTTGAFVKTIDNFNPTDDWTNVFMASDKVIPTLYSNLAELDDITDDPIVHAIAKVIKVAAMHRVTDTYGPIPYSQIGVGGKLTVPYDSQQKVFEEMFRELDEAISVFTENQGSMISAKADPVYAGNVDRWCKFANSLKLRLAMRIIYADETFAKARINEALQNPVGLISSNEESASLKPVAFGEKGNPIYTAVKYNQPEGSVTGGDSHAAAEIVSYMNAYEDPRRPKYFVPSEFDGEENMWVGVLVTAVKPPLTTQGRKYSGILLSPSSPLVWMNAAEVSFLKAEAAAVFGINVGDTPENLYNEGIRLSFQEWGVSSEYESYVASEKKVKVTYSNPGGGESRSDVLSELCVRWDDTASKEVKQERIMIQKWIANYHLGNEAWADHRRTGYPRFFPGSDEGNKSQGSNKVDNVLGARRMPYPQSEKTTNPDNYAHAVSEYLKGPDNMATNVWWDCKPESDR